MEWNQVEQNYSGHLTTFSPLFILFKIKELCDSPMSSFLFVGLK